jgi:hypothetical protein
MVFSRKVSGESNISGEQNLSENSVTYSGWYCGVTWWYILLMNVRKLPDIIQKGDDDSLLKAARAMHSIEGTNFELCVDIVRKTDNKRVLSQVDSNIYHWRCVWRIWSSRSL